MGAETNGQTARTLEIFLDYLVALATDNHSYLLADGYEQALSDGERLLRNRLQDLDRQLTDREKESSGGKRLLEMLKELGAAASEGLL